MSFSLEKLFVDVFAPRKGEIVTIMIDLPHGGILDIPAWQARRQMAEDWRREVERFSPKYGMHVSALVSYEATGMSNSDLPEYGLCAGRKVRLDEVARDSTIIISMPQFSATAPLVQLTRKYETLRVASMPKVTRAMQETALSADYSQIAVTCNRLAQLFDQSNGIEVKFSTGYVCYFDKSDRKPARRDDGILHPGGGMGTSRLSNLPAGEVFVTPNELSDSKTAGKIPVNYGSETAVFVVRNNRIVDVIGKGPMAAQKRQEFRAEKALCNIAEVAIGCNDKAVVTGIVLEDEKAGFHWAHGRSEHLGGTVAPKDFSSPDKVLHEDIVYARGNPIVCARLDFILADGTRKTGIVDGVLVP